MRSRRLLLAAMTAALLGVAATGCGDAEDMAPGEAETPAEGEDSSGY